jgi:hypothetical protein
MLECVACLPFGAYNLWSVSHQEPLDATPPPLGRLANKVIYRSILRCWSFTYCWFETNWKYHVVLVQSPHLHPILFHQHWSLNQGSPLSCISPIIGGTNAIYNSQPKHNSVMLIFIINVPSCTPWKPCPKVPLTKNSNIKIQVTILLQMYSQWLVTKIWFLPNAPTSTPHQQGTKHLNHLNHHNRSTCLLHDLKLQQQTPNSHRVPNLKAGQYLRLYIHKLYGNVPNYSFPTTVQLQLNCSNLWNKLKCQYSVSLISMSVDFYLKTIVIFIFTILS